MSEIKEKIRPSFGFAMLIMLINVAILVGGLAFLEVDPHILMIVCIIVIAFGAAKLGYNWEEMLKIMCEGINKAMTSLLFFFMIGMTIGAWMLSGTVPAIIYHGFNILSPGVFLPAGLIICSITSMATGSSWTTAGTVGIALMGIGNGLGIPAPLIAGMVVSGAYFGDKMSPLSDTTNLAPAISGTDVYSHIRAMGYTAIPSYAIVLILYFIIGRRYIGTDMDTQGIVLIQEGIASIFDVSPVVFIPIVVVLVTSVMKVPAIPSMTLGIVSSIPISIFLQGSNIKELIEVLNYGFASETGVEAVDKLLTRGGIQSMMWTFSLTVIALSMGGLLSETGILSVIVEKILRVIRNPRLLPGAAIISAFLVNITMAEQYVSIVIAGELYGEAFEKANIQRRMLSRALEEGGTLTSPLVPWNTCGAVMYAALGVSALQYAPYAYFNLINALMGIVLPIFGITLLLGNDAPKASIKEEN